MEWFLRLCTLDVLTPLLLMNRRRRQDALGRMTPIEFETMTQTAHAA